MKKILSLILALTMAVGLAACGSAEAPAEETTEGTEAGEAVTLTVAATATPHAEILAQVVDVLAEQGITLVVDEYNDYVTQKGYLADFQPQIYGTYGGEIHYSSFRMAFIGGVYDG